MERREFIKKSLLFGSVMFWPSRSLASVHHEKRLRLYHIHTGESIDTVYWADGQYHYQELRYLNRFFRDYHTDEIHPIDVRLFEYLHGIDRLLGGNHLFYILSAYRSPRTNELLRRHNRGVAKKSFHVQGKAVDIRLTDMRLSAMRRAALALKAGGVGYYPRSNFLHIDTGTPRYWRYPKR